MDNKYLKKSTLQQLTTLVEYMQDNQHLAKGIPVFGASKLSTGEEWKQLTAKLNNIGPPTRTIDEWKKTWADLKSRTKKKIASNQKSLRETGGGLYRFSNLTQLEEMIDRTLCLSSAVAPSGKVFGFEGYKGSNTSIEACFVSLVESPTTSKKKTVAVVTPTRLKVDEKLNPETTTNLRQTPLPLQQKNLHKRQYCNESDDYHPASSSTKKKKTTVEEQLALIRRQIKIAEQTVAANNDQAVALKRLADAADIQAESSKRVAIAAEAQTISLSRMEESINRMEKILEKYFVK